MMNTLNLNSRSRQIAKAYYIAKGAVIRQGYAEEMDWQYDVSFETLNEPTFLREAAWVILSSGMRESVIRQKFDAISQAFFNWQSAHKIMARAKHCKINATRHFRHEGKIEAILTVTSHIYQHGFPTVAKMIQEGGVEYLQQLPYIGPATSYHLAKNIGLPLAKPDRHLCRLSIKLGYSSPQQLCADIAKMTDDPVPVIDIVLWRYSILYGHYINRFVRLLNTKGD